MHVFVLLGQYRQALYINLCRRCHIAHRLYIAYMFMAVSRKGLYNLLKS